MFCLVTTYFTCFVGDFAFLFACELLMLMTVGCVCGSSGLHLILLLTLVCLLVVVCWGFVWLALRGDLWLVTCLAYLCFSWFICFVCFLLLMLCVGWFIVDCWFEVDLLVWDRCLTVLIFGLCLLLLIGYDKLLIVVLVLGFVCVVTWGGLPCWFVGVLVMLWFDCFCCVLLNWWLMLLVCDLVNVSVLLTCDLGCFTNDCT